MERVVHIQQDETSASSSVLETSKYSKDLNEGACLNNNKCVKVIKKSYNRKDMKLMKDRGIEYVTRNEVVKPKKLKALLNCCKQHYYEKINEDQQRKIFESFWAIGWRYKWPGTGR